MAPLPPRVSSRSRLSREPSEAIAPPPCCWLGGSMMEREREPAVSVAGPVGRERQDTIQGFFSKESHPPFSSGCASHAPYVVFRFTPPGLAMIII